MLTSFNHLEVIGNHHIIFQLKICVLFISLAMQNPSILSISICVLKPLVVEGVFQTRNLDFLPLLNECCLGSKVFMFIEVLSKKNGEAETWDNGKTQNEVWT